MFCLLVVAGVLGSQPAVTEAINLMVGCYYFPPGPWLPPQPPSITTGTKLYCLMTEAHVCKQLAQGCTQQHGSQDSNPRPVDHKSGFLTTQPPSLHCYNFFNFCLTSLFCWRFLQVVLGPHSSSKEDLMVIAGVNVFIGQMPFQSPNQQWSEGLEVHDVNELVDYLSLANYCFFDG